MFRSSALGAGLLGLSSFGLLIGCSGGSNGGVPLKQPAPAASSATSAASPASTLVSVAYASDALQGAQYVGPATFAATSVEIVPAMTGGAALEAYARSVSDPASPNFRHFLTPQQIGAQFGAPPGAYAATLAYFHHLGLAATGWPQRQLIHVGGTQAQLEAALDAKFGLYRDANGGTFTALTSAPRLPESLGVASVARAVGIEPSLGPIPIPPNTGEPGLSAQQIQRVFDYDGAYAAGFTGRGIHVGIIAAGQTSLPYDVTAVGAMYGLPVANVAYAPVMDPSPAPTACVSPSPQTKQTSPCISLGLTTPPTITPYAQASAAGCLSSKATPTCVPDTSEAALDTQTVALLAPGSSVLFYLGFNPMYCAADGGPYTTCPNGTAPAYDLGGIIEDAELEQAVADDTSDVVSISLGECETAFDKNSYRPFAIASLVAEGVSVFVSSGDDGARSKCQETTPELGYPSSDPNVASVGGVFVPVDASGQLDGQMAAWSFQNTGGSPASNSAGSGGGYSTVWPEPASQLGITSVTDPTQMRMVPDLSLDASGHSALQLLRFAGPNLGGPVTQSGDGTSEAAPEAAAMWALVLQACAATPSCATASGPHPYRLGDPKPYLYGIYNGNGKAGMTYADTFYDVTYGNNSVNLNSPAPSATFLYGYQAGAGYDLVTGLGAPYARALIKAITGA